MIFAITNQKGGVGKTTTTINLGACLAFKGKTVLLIDMDPQANLTSGLGVKDFEYTTYDFLIDNLSVNEVITKTRIANLDIIPSTINLAGADIELSNKISRETILKRKVAPVTEKYDFILIDCPPSLSILPINSLVLADKVIIPVQTEYFALEGISQLVETINLVKSTLNPSLDVGGVVLTMFDARTNLAKDVVAEVKSFFAEKVFQTSIARNIKLSEAPSHGLSIVEYDPRSQGAIAYSALADEFLNRFGVVSNA